MESKKKPQEEAVRVDPLEGLSDKEKLFVNEYARHFNATRAAKNAGYEAANLSHIGWTLKRKVEISRAIGLIMEQHVMAAGEALSRMSSIASGSLETFVTEEGVIDVTSEQARENFHLVKKYKRKVEKRIDPVTETPIETETTEIELYAADSALDKILQLHGKYKQLIGQNNGNEDQEVMRVAEGIYIKF